MWFAHAIRGPACLLVVAVHLGYVFWGDQPTAAAIGHFPALAVGPHGPWPRAYLTLADWHVYVASVAVCMFFLVSGFVVPFALERGTLRTFFVRRFFRIYPTVWACLLINLVALAIQARILGTAFPYRADDVAGNAFLLSPYLRAPWIEPVLWSLAIEELFYLLAAFVAWRRALARGSAIILLAAGLTVLSLGAANSELGSPLFWLACNATFVIFILLGVVFHQVYRRRWGWLQGAAVIVGLLTAFEVSLYWGAAAPIAPAYGVSGIIALGLFAAIYRGRERLPQWKFVGWLGDISFPLYLVHAVNGYLVLRVVWLATESYYLAIAVALVATTATATVVHYLVDRPTNEFGRRMARGMRARAAAADPVVAAPVDAAVTAPTPVGPAG